MAIARGLADLQRHFDSWVDKITDRFVLDAQAEDPENWNQAKDDAHTSVARLVETLHGGDLPFYPLSQNAIALRFVPGWDGLTDRTTPTNSVRIK